MEAIINFPRGELNKLIIKRIEEKFTELNKETIMMVEQQKNMIQEQGALIDKQNILLNDFNVLHQMCNKSNKSTREEL